MGKACAIARSLGVIGDWWSMLIVRDALAGKRRFGEFQSSLGLAKNLLSTRLQKLVAHGVLTVVPASDGSVYKEYIPTDKARKLQVLIIALWQWGEEFCFAPGELTYDIADKETCKPLRPIELRAMDGRIIGPGDTRALARPAARKPRPRKAVSGLR